MNVRVRELRKALNLSQEVFAEKVGLTKNYISLVETGNRSLADRTVKDICRIFDVNEEWLKTGKGNIFVEKTKDERISELLADVQNMEDGKFKRRFVSVLAKMSDEEWDFLEKLIDDLAEEKAKEKQKKEKE